MKLGEQKPTMEPPHPSTHTRAWNSRERERGGERENLGCVREREKRSPFEAWIFHKNTLTLI